MAIILNVIMVFIWSGSKVTTYNLISAHCLKTHVHMFSQQVRNSRKVCQRWHDERKWWKLTHKRTHLDGLQEKPCDLRNTKLCVAEGA